MQWLARSERRLESRSERWRRWWRRLAGSGWVKEQQIWAVRIGGITVKRIAYGDASEAARLERQLELTQGTGVTPQLIARYGAELWVEYLKGDPIPRDAVWEIDALADLLAPLWQLEPRRLDPRAAGFAANLERDLDFLERAGVLRAHSARELRQCAKEWEPAALWWGTDYSDLRPQNLLRMRNGRLAIVDIESLTDAFPLGTGIAKAAHGWLAGKETALLARLAEAGAPDVRNAFPYVALAQLAWWQKRCLLRNKRRSVNPALFDQLRRVHPR